jgi:hypothetical protein
MLTTRFFDRLVDPRDYRVGFGVRGVWLNVLNRVRAWLETRVARHILILECRRAGASKSETGHVLEQASSNPYFQPDFVKPAEKRRERKVLLRDKIPALYETLHAKAELRYAPGRANDKTYDRPVPLERGMHFTFAEEAKKRDRSARYAGGRLHQVVIDGDGIIAVGPESGGKND